MFLYMAQEFPEADLYTLCYNPETTLPEFRGFDIRTSWMNPFVRDHKRFKSMFPIATKAMEVWDFRGYDIVLTSSATTAKYVRRLSGTHVCYCYFPTRAIWNCDAYFGNEKQGFKQRIFRSLIPYFRGRDKAAASRVDRFIAISESSRTAIREFYERDAQVLFCPIDTDRFAVGAHVEKRDYYLIVSRLERWKCLDFAIEAFNRSRRPLRIIGTGDDELRLKSLAGPNVTFVGSVDDQALVRAYGEARAVIFTPELEYGLVPLEAVGAGTPVIAYGRAGVLETMVGPEDPQGRGQTAVFFDAQTPEAVVAAVERFEQTTFERAALLSHAASFGIMEFKKRLRAAITETARGIGAERSL